MPNWCENELYIRGKKEVLDRFKETVSEGDQLLSANKLIPYPRAFKVLDDVVRITPNGVERRRELTEKEKAIVLAAGLDPTRDGFNQGGYEWCCENWGTKWGFCHVKIVDEYDCSEDEIEIEYAFDTAWSPPIPLIKKMGEMFPELSFELRYFECGVGFNGILRIENGEVVQDECAAYFGHRGG